jgi:capsular exopolysaccharide family
MQNLKINGSLNKIPIVNEGAPFQFVEAYNSLRTNLQFALGNKNNRRIIVTSALHGEGKSTTTLNLAIVLANSDYKVLLVNCDLRMPTLYLNLNLQKTDTKGLSSVLTGKCQLEECLVKVEDEKGFTFLPSGPVPSNPAELLGSFKMSKIITDLSSQYDYILFDTPPVAVVTDAAVLSKFTDGVVFVVSQNLTTIEAAKAAKKSLSNVGANVIGCILNNYNVEQRKKSYGYYSYNYNYNYYDRAHSRKRSKK